MFYSKQSSKQITYCIPLLKEEPEIKEEVVKKEEPFQSRTVLKMCKATSYLISAGFREPMTRPMSVFRPKQKKKLKKMLFTMDDLMFLAS